MIFSVSLSLCFWHNMYYKNKNLAAVHIISWVLYFIDGNGNILKNYRVGPKMLLYEDAWWLIAAFVESEVDITWKWTVCYDHFQFHAFPWFGNSANQCTLSTRARNICLPTVACFKTRVGGEKGRKVSYYACISWLKHSSAKVYSHACTYLTF